MIDARETWRAACAYQRQHYGADLIERAFSGGGWMLGRVLTLAPVVDQGEYFELAADLARPAPVRAHRWLIAVRCWSNEQLVGPDLWDAPASRCRRAIGAGARALLGEDVVDVLACDARLSRVRAQLTGEADVLGDVECDDGEPVRLVQTPLQWLRGLAGGVLVVGPLSRRQTTLRAMRGGIVCDDIAHGEAVQRLLRREVPPLPRVMVAG